MAAVVFHAVFSAVFLAHGHHAMSARGAAVDGHVPEGVSLVQTSSLIHEPPFVHARRGERKAALSLVLDTSAVQEQISAANLTLAAVPNILLAVNSSALALLDEMDDSLSAAISAMENVKQKGAMLSPDASQVLTRIADEFIVGATKSQVHLEKVSKRVEDTVIKIVTHFTLLTAKALGAFQHAVDTTNAINADAGALLQSKHRDDHGPFDWLFGGQRKFHAARRAITRANTTVQKVDDMLTSVNDTAVVLLTEDTLGAAQAGVTELRNKLDLISLPLAVSRILKGICSQLTSFIGIITTKVISSQRKIRDEISAATVALPLLHGAADSLMSLVDSAQDEAF